MTFPANDCDRFRDDLAGWIEGDVSPEAAAHLAGCDACRDLRHEAGRVARGVPRAGADYVAPDPEALVARVLAALPVAAPAGSVRTPPHGTLAFAATQVAPPAQAAAPFAPPPQPTPAPYAPPAHAAAPGPFPAPPPAGPFRQPAPQGYAPPAVRPGPSRAPLFVGLGLTFAVAAGAIGVLAVRTLAPSPGDDAPHAAPVGPWSARVGRVLRASADAAGGFEVQAPGAQGYVAAQEAAALAPGSRVRTDAKTRARLELDDGSVLVLDRATEVVLDAAAPRAAQLVAGNLVADVAHRDGASAARIATAAGPVEVLGTRFALAADGDRANVRVTRGVVKVGDAARAVEVKTGQEATLSRAEGVSVAPAVDLAGATAWADLAVDPADAPVVGLGELRARRPGATAERDQALHLASHGVKVRVVGNVARTEVEEVFRNDTGQELEGVYRFPLPPEAQVETLALDVNGRMELGSFVERDRAAAIWRGVIRHATPRPQPTREEYVWVPGPWHDPALLEWQRGGRFELRVFPIPAHGSRRVAISYTQAVAPSGGARRYVYPLPHNPDGSTRVDQFSLDVQVLGHDRGRGVRASGYPLAAAAGDAPAGAERFTFAQQNFVPSGDLLVEYELPEARAPLTAWTYQPPATPDAPAEPGYVALALRPSLPRWADARPRDYVFAVDASRSMVGERIARAARVVSAAVAEMDPRDRVTVLACDTRCRPMGEAQYASAEVARGAMAFLNGADPAGASDLVGQLRDAARAAQAGAAEGRDVRIVYVGDGASTVGWRRPEHIAAEAAAIVPRGAATVTAVAVGGDADAQSLAALARGGGGVLVPYVPGERARAAALSTLEATYGVMLRDPEVTLPPGLTAPAPAKVGSIRAGSEALVLARMSAPSVAGDVVVRGTVNGEPYEARYPVNLRMTGNEGNAFVPRLYAAARIADLEASGGPTAQPEILALSQRFRVASRYTSLLVLESPAMFRAFGVERNTAAPQWTGETASESTVTAAQPGAGDEALDDLTADAAGELQRSAGGGSGAGYGLGAGRARGDLGTMGSAAPAAPAAPARVAPAARASNGGQIFNDGPSASVTQREMPMRRAPPRGRWMRRVWTRRAELAASAGGDVDRALSARADRAREALLAMPDSRDRHRELYRWLALAGEVDDAADVAARWTARDPLDPDAIARLADVAALRGEREKSVRVLSGVLDVRPDDLAAHERMATLHERANDAEAACAYRVSAAEVRPQDASVVARAVRCLRLLGRTESVARMLNAVPDAAVRTRAEAEASVGLAAPASEVRGELTVTATWEGGEDLDLAVIDPRGQRISWQGGRAGVTARQATDPSSEALGLARLSSGEHAIDVVRVGPGRGPVRVRVHVRALGQERTFTVTLTGARARAAKVNVVRESQLVPASGPVPGGSFVAF
ncbi:MAG: FecR domain-containing protein [Polyangiales bacterium]